MIVGVLKATHMLAVALVPILAKSDVRWQMHGGCPLRAHYIPEACGGSRWLRYFPEACGGSRWLWWCYNNWRKVKVIHVDNLLSR
jgi:hypothetical protein